MVRIYTLTLAPSLDSATITPQIYPDSDYLIKRGLSLTLARKLPIVLGMLLASTIILCNYTNYTNNTTLVVMLMALAFFGKGFGALGWPVISDTAPKELPVQYSRQTRGSFKHPCPP